MRPAGIFFVGQAASRPRRCDPNRAETGGGLVVLDPSSEIALMMIAHRRKADRKVIVLDPIDPTTDFNALDGSVALAARRRRTLL